MLRLSCDSPDSSRHPDITDSLTTTTMSNALTTRNIIVITVAAVGGLALAAASIACFPIILDWNQRRRQRQYQLQDLELEPIRAPPRRVPLVPLTMPPAAPPATPPRVHHQRHKARTEEWGSYPGSFWINDDVAEQGSARLWRKLGISQAMR